MTKTGADHLNSLNDGRAVYLDGQRVADPVSHPAFAQSIASIAALYDFQAANPELMTFASPTSGRQVNLAWLLPRSYQELVKRRAAMTAWARLHYGFMGRSPDHVASCLVGQMVGIEVFEAYDPKRAAALSDYFAYARDNDLFVTYVIINPQADRSKDWSSQADEHLVCGLVDEDRAGITVRGAKMLGTGTIMSNEIFVANIQPLKPGEERYALSFALPIGTKGIKLLSRKSYAAHAVSEFDNPLSFHFDENDAVVYFDDVQVPWERVFICRNTDMARAQFQDTGAHLFQNYQAQVRLVVKLRFLLGIARLVAETNGIAGFAQVREKLGWIAAQASMVEGLVLGMEAGGAMRGDYFAPSRHLMYAAQVVTQEVYARVIDAIRELAGGGLIMLPSSAADFGSAELAALIHKTQKSPATDPEGRVKAMKLAWDAIGSEFASRHVQYEMFYAGAQFTTKAHMMRTFPWDEATGLVDDLLSRYRLADSVATARRFL